ncbi:MAG TPA: nucleotidyltransferase family protein [Solirubrobacteraceae bacterium]|jgi:molybdenum cofactor cytidylyltransferase|nr:nucleotidyltransferase family protein [Solirubrobacteraceae bacterium]
MREPGSADQWITGLVLAAGGSKRLGQAKQLLPYGGAPLLGHVLQTARSCPFDQLLCVVGGASAEVRRWVDLREVEVVENEAYGDGCSSSIAAALEHVDEHCDVLVLMLGDQPGVGVANVEALLDGRGDAPLAACAYRDGRGHPLAFARSMFGELTGLHGDKGVWKLMDSHAGEVADVEIEGPIPLDVDTWDDYRRVLLAAAHV